MINLYKKILMISALLHFTGLGFGQAGEIRVRFIANSGLHMTDGHSNIYIDFPYKPGAYHMYSEYDLSEIDSIKDNAVLIFTHKHWDHYYRKLVKKARGQKYGPWNLKKLKQLGASLPDFAIEPFKTRHRYSFKHYSYLVTWHGKRIFISGDTEHAEIIAALKNLDWAFAPVWLLIDANSKNIKIDSKKIGLYHIGPKDKITTENPKIHLMDKQGEIILIPY